MVAAHGKAHPGNAWQELLRVPRDARSFGNCRAVILASRTVVPNDKPGS